MKRFSSRKNRLAEDELIDADDDILDIEEVSEDDDFAFGEELGNSEGAGDVTAEDECKAEEVEEEVSLTANRSVNRLLRMASRIARKDGRISRIVRNRIAEDVVGIGEELKEVCEGEDCENSAVVEAAEELAETTVADIPPTADAVARVLAKYARKLRSATEEVPVGEPVVADNEPIGAEGAEEIKYAVARSIKRLASNIEKMKRPLTAAQMEKVKSFVHRAAAKVKAAEEGSEEDPKFTEMITTIRNGLKTLAPVKAKKSGMIDKAAPQTKFNMMTVEQILDALIKLINAK